MDKWRAWASAKNKKEPNRIEMSLIACVSSKDSDQTARMRIRAVWSDPQLAVVSYQFQVYFGMSTQLFPNR